MSKKIGTYRKPTNQVLVSILVIATVLPSMALARADEVLTNENILSLLRWKAKPQEVVAVIERNATRFDLSGESVSKLRESGVTNDILEAMWKATLKASNNVGVGLSNQQPSTDHSAGNGIRTGEAKGPNAKTADLKPTPPASDPPKNPCEELKAAGKEHSTARLVAVQAVVAEPQKSGYPVPPMFDESCPLSDNDPASGKPKTPRHVDLDWRTGSISPSCVDRSGKYCFALHNVNNILYTYGFTVNRIQPQGSDLDLLKEAIGKVKDLFGGAAKAEAICSLETKLTDAKAKSDALQAALSLLDPGKDASGKPTSVPLDTTKAKWKAVPAKFEAFEVAVRELIKLLPKPGDALPTNCTACDLGLAEAMVLDVYVPARERYLALTTLVGSQNVARYTTDLDSTSAYELVVKEYYGGQQTTAEAKTFHLDACRKILISSAGFLLTQLQARSYVSRTAPDPSDPTKTQNVLSVDGGGRMRPALTALLNYNLPWQPWRNVGLAISAGPVFDISNGKADTSHFGFFGGGSLHLWNRLFLTPGVHVGEFADFPQGFSKPGQLIPDKTGTPNPVKRYTARFAFAITFKVSELGFGGGSGTDTSKKTASSQPKSASQ